MAPKKVADAAKAKAGKQKKIAIGLGLVLTLAMAYAVHTMMALGGKPSSLPQAAPVTLSTSTTSVPAVAPTAVQPAAPTLGGSATPTAGSPLSTQLVSAVRPPADAGQLQSFSLFASKDPFNSAGPKAAGSGGTGSGTGGAPKTPPAPPAAPAPPTAPPASAVIAVNGVSESVSSGGAFPAANPVFQLVSLSATTAKLSVVGGSYASGSPTVTLTVNRPVTLQNTADGTRYTLVLMPQGTVATAVPTGSPSPATSESTSPGTGTTTTTGG